MDEEEKLYVLGGKPQLFDLVADPQERADLALARPGTVGEKFAIGQRVFALQVAEGGSAEEIETTLSAEALENLRELGYIE